MDVHGIIAVATLVVAVTLFFTKRLPVEGVALAIPVVLAATGTLDPPELAISGFGNPAVIALAAVFVLGAGLKDSGVAALMARVFSRLAGDSVPRTLLVVMVPVAMFSSFVANAPTVAVFLPAVAALSRRKGIAPSILLLPLVHAALLGGVATVIGTTSNLLVAEELARRTGGGLAVVDFLKIGVPVAAVGVLYVALFGWRLLPRRAGGSRDAAPAPEAVAASHGFPENLYRLRVLHRSTLAGKTIEEAGLGQRYDVEIVQVIRLSGFGARYLSPEQDLVLSPSDELLVEGEAVRVWTLAETELLQLGMAGDEDMAKILERGTTLAEITLEPHSTAIGKSLRVIGFRARHGVTVVSIWRRGDTLRAGLGDTPIELGDALLVAGAPRRIRALAKDPDFIVLSDQEQTEDLRRAPLAAFIVALALIPPLFGWLPLAASALGGALLMLATRCTTVSAARRAVDLRVLFLIVGTLPLGLALEQHGIARAVAGAMLALGGAAGPLAVLAALFVVSALISTVVNNCAAVILLAPVAAGVSAVSGLPVDRAFLAVAFGASCVFLWPYGNQAGMLVMGPGGYTSRDFFRAGLVPSLLYAVTAVTLISLL